MDLIGILIDLIGGVGDLRKRSFDVITVLVIVMLGFVLLLTIWFLATA